MKITVRVTKVYGSVTIYPVCETAKLLAMLAGTKTITSQALDVIEKLGYRIEIVPETITLRRATDECSA
jgi:hypothetical protein